ncbi:hypothetical protein [Sinorhizobium meliloti]|uniref:hypothetical protein n=1 Tax=Rhizobium meliloti TaxID=382 RepID=UPI000FDC7B8C|nr:hypothetical protein [Sinorhizobium meliloti]RVM19649.1 hypothetical protein CN134_03100 [Sinorhizobium meliloti]RVO32487.1 hypothetical protein CN098_10460 [Sinorhizobium meliloti]
MSIYQFYQPPLYWQQFEDLAVELLREVYRLPDAQAFGRPGQAQHGVDVIGTSDEHGLIALQCKRLSDVDKNGNPYPGGAISRKFLFDAAAEIKGFPDKISYWILATTAKRDAAVQLHVLELTESGATRVSNAGRLFGHGTIASPTSTRSPNSRSATTETLFKYTAFVTSMR